MIVYCSTFFTLELGLSESKNPGRHISSFKDAQYMTEFCNTYVVTVALLNFFFYLLIHFFSDRGYRTFVSIGKNATCVLNDRQP